jgi:hypothetical protein
MTQGTVQEIVDDFTGKIAARLDAEKLDGPVRLDPTRSVVILKVKGKGPIHVHTDHQINDEGVERVIRQIGMVPSLKPLLKQEA